MTYQIDAQQSILVNCNDLIKIFLSAKMLCKDFKCHEGHYPDMGITITVDIMYFSSSILGDADSIKITRNSGNPCKFSISQVNIWKVLDYSLEGYYRMNGFDRDDNIMLLMTLDSENLWRFMEFESPFKANNYKEIQQLLD